MPDLPSELIGDILSRLPVKPLLQFRCVSKPWCALIDSPDFIKMHLNRSIQTRTNLSLILSDTYFKPHLYSVAFDSLERAIELDHPLKSDEHKTRVWGSCNGLLCLGNTEEDIVLWNPSTRKHWKLPIAPTNYPLVPGKLKNVVYGFGFDSVHDDYKVLRILQVDGIKPGDASMKSEVYVYSFKSNSWKRVPDLPFYLEFLREGLFVNGALHWDVIVRPDEDDQPSLIIAFDLVEEKYYHFHQPDWKDNNFLLTLGVLEGCLCVICSYGQGSVVVWVMKEYGSEKSWARLISIPDTYVIRSFDELKPVAYSKCGGKVLLQHDGYRFFWHDLEKKTINRVRIRKLPHEFEVDVCLGSLVPLGESDRKQQAVQAERKKKINKRKR